MSLNKPMGTIVDPRYFIGGVNRVALIDKSKVTVAQDALTQNVTGITVGTGVTFYEVHFEEGTAAYTQEYQKASNGRYINQTINFTVATQDLPSVDALMLTKGAVALIQDKNGSWRAFGTSNGLVSESGTDNASEESGGAVVITMTGKNLGYAPFITMDETAIDALIAS